MSSSCHRCGAPKSPGARFCEQCGAPVGPYRSPAGVAYLPLLELHDGVLGTHRTPVVLEVSSDQIRVIPLPDYFAGTVEELRSRLEDACLEEMDRYGNYPALSAAWDWRSEQLISSIEAAAEELVKDEKRVVEIPYREISSAEIERIESDTVWDLLTIKEGKKTWTFDLTGPVAPYAFVALRDVLGQKVVYQDE